MFTFKISKFISVIPTSSLFWKIALALINSLIVFNKFCFPNF